MSTKKAKKTAKAVKKTFKIGEIVAFTTNDGTRRVGTVVESDEYATAATYFDTTKAPTNDVLMNAVYSSPTTMVFGDTVINTNTHWGGLSDFTRVNIPAGRAKKAVAKKAGKRLLASARKAR